MVRDLDTQWCQGVSHGVDKGRHGTDGAALPHAFVSSRIGERTGLDVSVLDDRYLLGRRQQVVHKCRRQWIPVVVVDHVLQEDAADTLHDPSGDLTMHHHRVDHYPAVLTDHEPVMVTMTGEGVDFADRDVTGVGVCLER